MSFTPRSSKGISIPLISHPTNASLIHPHSNQMQLLHNYQPVEQNYNYQYYEQYRKLYFTAYCLSIQMKKIIKSKDDLVGKLYKLQKKLEDQIKDQQQEPNPDRKKRFRRTAEEIQRKFQCNAERCGRNYGSEGSLQQHIKLKHPQLYAKRVQENGYHQCQSNNQSL